MPIDRPGALFGCAPSHFGNSEKCRGAYAHLSVGSLDGDGGHQISRRRFGVRTVHHSEPDDITLGVLND
jgi:hypothetical protein